jgi:predicted RNA-binding Zn ribbon-like protein
MSWKGLTGEPLAVDLVNTVVGTAHGDLDLFDGTDGTEATEALAEWLAIEQDRLTAQDPDAFARIDVAAIRGLRATVSEALADVRAGRRPARSAMATLIDAQRAAPGYVDLHWDGATATPVRRRDGSPTAVLLADLATATVDFLGDPGVTILRDCDGPNCRMVFLPTNPRRRWCRPSVCGNRARVARYYEAHKG